MTTTVYLIGEPGVGKTSVMDWLLQRHRVGAPVRLRGLLWGEPFPAGVHLGLRRPGGFSGTDALGMAVHPDAVAWARDPDVVTPRWIYGEGQRLATVAMMEALASRGPVLLAHLTASPLEVEHRRFERAAALGRTPQAASFVRGAATRAARLRDAAHRIPGVTVVTVDTGLLTELDAAHAVRIVAEAL